MAAKKSAIKVVYRAITVAVTLRERVCVCVCERTKATNQHPQREATNCY